MKPTGNTILITGGTSGIGLGLARRFASAGNAVIITGRREELLDRISAEHPGIEAHVLDVTDPGAIADVSARVVEEHPELNVLVNNAGIMLPEDLREGGWLTVSEDTVATNLLGPLRMTAALLPHLLGREEAAVINVSSGLAFVPLPVAPTYNATKAAIHSFSESLRVQLAGTSVQVIELVPPPVRTTLMGQQDDERSMPLEDYLSETMSLLQSVPEAGEILVERVKFLREAEAKGTYGEVLRLLSSI
ncbi:SDR family oxidoreductase [Streptomyces sp. ME03-5709C]|nr:SDR family oxidoreductase [Streptomyces sp. ME03-5709C]